MNETQLFDILDPFTKILKDQQQNIRDLVGVCRSLSGALETTRRELAALESRVDWLTDYPA